MTVDRTAAELALIDSNIEEYLARHERKELLRFLTCGSVDDGKSTLIGRLLVDTKAVLQDHLAGVQRSGETDLALLTDGLSAEREQGITIDVAYRYFATPRRKFIIADTMDLWLNIALPDVLKLLKRVDCLVLNDSEARQLVSDDNVVSALTKIHRMGPEYVIIKKGEHGSILSGPKGLFIAPAYPLRKVVDPTGAGDSFVGGLIGYLAAQKSGSIETNLRRAILHGSVVASFCCEGFGLNVTTRTTKAQILARVKELEKLSQF